MEIMVYLTDPMAADTDGDTFDDGSEIEGGFDPTGEGILSEERLAAIQVAEEELDAAKEEFVLAAQQAAEAAELAAQKPDFVVQNDMLFMGEGTLTAPEVGDIRISYQAIESGQTGTAFGMLSSGIITPYFDDKDNRLHSLSVGSRENALQEMHTEYVTSLWLMRLFGFLLMWIGLSMIMGPISVLLDVLPLLGRVSRMVVGLATFVVSLVLTALTILLSRLLHSPIAIGISLVIVGGVIVFLVMRGRKKAQAAPAPVQQTPPQPPAPPLQ
jgi:hypothetical protein